MEMKHMEANSVLRENLKNYHSNHTTSMHGLLKDLIFWNVFDASQNGICAAYDRCLVCTLRILLLEGRIKAKGWLNNLRLKEN